MSTVTDGIERTSREIGRRLAPGDMYDGSTPAGWLEVQIVFWSERLEDKRRLHKDHLLQILRAECAIGTDLLQITDVYHGTQPGDAGRRDRLKDRLLDLDRERRQAGRPARTGRGPDPGEATSLAGPARSSSRA